ncbi:MAG: TerC/Alx family metal homeostasis membrane protein [Flavobacteriales bacterium]|nr:TerC/Alx family metal homeostasis membrane protein [Bacteroidota bacterium]MCB9239915.1 TerC/Alx family metal homeostasis membrane protein [Flavobacteriales bacterium]
MHSSELIFFSLFIVFILFVLLLDLGVFSKENKVVTFREALIWSLTWVACAVGFYFLLKYRGHMIHGPQNLDELREIIDKFHHPVETEGRTYPELLQAYRNNLSLEYLTGYFIEYALSVDNIFVMLLIFTTFGVRERYYKRVLFWGVLGALVMRFVFIFAGAAIIQQFSWVLYVFGAFLVYSGVRILWKGEEEETIDEKNHPVVKLVGKLFPVFPRYVGENFFIRKDRRLWVTPLFIVLFVIEFSDLIFAVDSVPAIFVVTKDPYIVFFSNIFAIMGLRSMFFLLSNIMHVFRFLKYGLGVLLTFIGLKMLMHHWFVDVLGIDNQMSLIIVAGILGVSILLSIIFPAQKEVDF